MFRKFQLGLVYRNGQIINHRCLLKVLLNPILRVFGREIGSVIVNEKVNRYKWCKCDKKALKFDFKYTNEYDFILPVRRII